MKIHVMLEGAEPFAVDTRPVDMVRFEETAAKHKWGSAKDSPMRFVYFLAFAAAARENKFDRARGFNVFMDELIDAEPDTDDDEMGEDENPTEREPMLD